jgi:hypothetical protein
MAKAALWIMVQSQSWETNQHRDNRLVPSRMSASVVEYVNFDNVQRVYVVNGDTCSLRVEMVGDRITRLFEGSTEDCHKRLIAIWQAVANRVSAETGFLFVDMNEHVEDEEVGHARELVGVPPADRSSGDNGGVDGTA